MKGWYSTTHDNAIVIKAMLNDEEFMCGGIFTKEDYYMRKYGLTFEQISDMQTYLYKALSIGYLT